MIRKQLKKQNAPHNPDQVSTTRSTGDNPFPVSAGDLDSVLGNRNRVGDNSDKPDKHAGGRPTKYRPEYCDKVIQWGKQGYSKTEMADELGVGRRALYDWVKEHSEFSHALEIAMASSEAWWEREARVGITQPTKEFNAGLFGKIMSARFPETYRETTHTLLGGVGGGPIPVVVSNIPDTVEGMRDYYKQWVDKATRPISKHADPVQD